MTNESVELKPCPFCGGNNLESWDGGEANLHMIECYDCDCSTGNMISLKYAIEAWNTRTPQWVSVEDGLPEEGLCILGFEPHCLLNRDKGVGVIVADYDITEIRKATGKPWITHWMPLPTPPTKG